MQQRTQEIDAVQSKYASRIRGRLAESSLDVTSARDGIMECFVATYFGGLKHGIRGYLNIDADEQQVSQIAERLFRKKLRAVGGSFDHPTVEHLDRVKQEVDREMHFEELPAELRALHDQVLMLAKAEGTLEHDGARSSIKAPRTSPAPPPIAAIESPARRAPTPPVPVAAPRVAAPRVAAPSVSAPSVSAPSVSAPSSAPPTSRSPAETLRGLVIAQLDEMARVVRDGGAPDQLDPKLLQLNELMRAWSAF